MVGNEAKTLGIKKRQRLSQAVVRFLDAPFALGDMSKGWDCLNSLAEFYDSMGAEFPRKFGDWDESNYVLRWNENEKKSREVFRQFLRSLGKSVDWNYAVAGDLLLFERMDIPIFPGIYMGNGNVLINWGVKKGMKVAPLTELLKLKFFIEARRLL
jgi:hypothetical protein